MTSRRGGPGLDLIDVAGHQLQGGAGEAGAAAVLHRDPALEVGLPAVRIQLQHVVGVPGQAAGEVAHVQVGLAAALGLRPPDQGGPGAQVLRQLRQRDAARHIEDHLAGHLVDGPRGHAQQACASIACVSTSTCG